MQLKHDLRLTPAWLELNASLRGVLAQLLLAGTGRDLRAEGGGQRAVHGLLAPRAADVDLGAVWPDRYLPAVRDLRRCLNQLPGECRHRVVVAVGLVDLEHRELGVMRSVRSLV